ncbi:ORC1-type DNA replication protein [Candidatus Woesearchaeota archaeon]|nr:ORC1-type DNA replication protein [Candidatus Woesearchaeota archaeon]MBT3537318.1 ORC1-type DNA replication protein [Candidatus Woesearchaeota archaeon]MBT4697437.1 ORC1-type DNA replication protein [Candidatus Woesearchaeota archaeon]MBT4716716.1 ORC1-type DNA replication protein [Candidatus Woesearchaeota archaeon]MBT7106372.1 ORC1-type DNA replication protein [Candidatus Woesearchaeota archaeon]
MVKKGITGLFEDYLTKEPLFLDKEVLQANYTPDNIPHRDDQITQIAKILAPALRLNKPSNLFVYGKTGTGKTLSVRHTTNHILEVSKKNKIPVKVFYINCKLKRVADTEYRLIAQLAREFGKAVPPTGLPTDEVYKIFYNAIDHNKQVVLLILDEIDQLVKKAGDEILYNLTRINSELKNAQISVVGISNDLVFTDNLDPRVKSSLSEEELVFPPYNALQIQDILNQRAKVAFRDGILRSGVIEKCAAYAAKEHGDARRALELLRIAGELAERSNELHVEIEHLDLAEEKIERDRMVDIVSTQPKQFQAVLYSIYAISETRKGNISTGEVYDVYKSICNRTALRPLTQRRLSDILAELDMLGIINAKVISKGRYGRTKEISLATQPSIEPKIRSILKNDLGLA